MALGPQGNHKSQESYLTATPPIANAGPVDPGYVKPIRTLQFGPQGNTSAGIAHSWPDSFQRP